MFRVGGASLSAGDGGFARPAGRGRTSPQVFSFLLGVWPDHDAVYRSLITAISLLLCLCFPAAILLFGAEPNAELGRAATSLLREDDPDGVDQPREVAERRKQNVQQEVPTQPDLQEHP